MALVQAKTGSGTSSPITVTLTSATTAGNCLVVCIGEGNSTTNPTVSGITLGGSADNFALGPSVKVNADANVEIWVDPNCAGGQTAVAVSFSGGTGAGNGVNVTVFEESGIVASSPIDKQAAAGAASGAWSSGSTGTLTQTNEVAFGVGAGKGSAGAPTITGPSSPWSNQASTSAARTTAIAGRQAVTATTALSYAGTVSSGAVGAAIVTLLESSGTTVSPPVAQVTIAAPAPAPTMAPAPAAAQVTVAAPAPAPTLAPAPAAARVTIAALAPRLPLIAPTARVVIAAPAPIAVGGPLAPTARVVIAAPAPTPVKIPRLLVSIAAAAGVDDFGTPFPQGIQANAGLIEGPTIIGSDAFYYSPSPGANNLTQSIASSSGTDQYGNAYLAGTTTYNNAGSFWSAISILGGVVQWYKATTAAGPWTFEAEIAFNWNNLTGGGLVINAPAGLSGTVGASGFQIPVSTPSASAAAIISALQLAGIFQ